MWNVCSCFFPLQFSFWRDIVPEELLRDNKRRFLLLSFFWLQGLDLVAFGEATPWVDPPQSPKKLGQAIRKPQSLNIDLAIFER